MSEDAKVGAIYALIPLIAGKLGAVKKARRNVDQNYAFRGIDDFLNALHPLLAAHQVFVVPEVIGREEYEIAAKSGAMWHHTVLTIRHTFYGPDGSQVAAVTVGRGADASDKGANKAMTASLKYALIEVFSVPTADIDEGDAQTPGYEQDSGAQGTGDANVDGRGGGTQARTPPAGLASQIIADAKKAGITEAQIVKQARLLTDKVFGIRDISVLSDDELGKLEVLIDELKGG